MAPPEKQELARLAIGYGVTSVSLLRLDFGWFGDSRTIRDITLHI